MLFNLVFIRRREKQKLDKDEDDTMRGKVTIQEIADQTGLSKYAVSRALSGKPGVSTQTREMILKTAGTMGYFKEPVAVFNELVDLDVRTWSGTILVLFPNVRHQNRESSYWGPIFEGISASLSKKKINILTLTEPQDESMFSLLNPEGIMGILTIGNVSTSTLFDIRKLNIPIVMVDHLDPSFNCDTVFTDNFAGMREMMNAMIHRGYRKFQFIGNIKDAHSYRERWLEFNASLAESGIPQEQLPALLDHRLDEFYATLEETFASRELPEVFVCANDFYVNYTIESFERIGIPIDGKVVFTGFDHVNPPPSCKATISVNEELLGKRAVDQLLWRILNPSSSYERKLLRGDLVLKD
ncbi:DNA-binding transcriptional regulator [Paenibacillus pasadenensis]|uniref:DNA-binding transcriptional regulator n=2 Tax=Paenibacillus pasadenensis TaxID=217090 RepID=A0A2N5N368_9BACL|nr:DNA-binding transcriptional regulator [Paenibacillus pasadenensis]